MCIRDRFAPCLHVSDYVTVPTNDVYDVGQLIAKPDITAKLNGKDLTVDYDLSLIHIFHEFDFFRLGFFGRCDYVPCTFYN